MNTKEENQENKSKEAKKIEKAYDNAIAKASALLGKHPFAPVKTVPGDMATELMEEMFKEEFEEKKKEFKSKFKELLTKKRQYDIVISQERQKFEKTILEKKKSFTKEVEEAVSLIGGIENIKNDYLRNLVPSSKKVNEVRLPDKSNIKHSDEESE